MTTPAELLQPDARMTRVLAGELGFAPPSFSGLAGIAVDGEVAALAIGSGETVLVLAAPHGAQADPLARHATDGMRPARVEWTDGLVPTGGSAVWSSQTQLATARIVTEGGELLATLTVSPLAASDAALRDLMEAETGVPAFSVIGAPHPMTSHSRGAGHSHTGRSQRWNRSRRPGRSSTSTESSNRARHWRSGVRVQPPRQPGT